MPKLVPFRPTEIKRILLKNGFMVNVSKSSHRQYYNSETKAHTTVSFHSTKIPIGTLRAIIRQSQLPRDLFAK